MVKNVSSREGTLHVISQPPWHAQAAAEGVETGPPDGGRDMHFLLGNCSGKFIDMESGLAGLDVQLQRTNYWRDVFGFPGANQLRMI